MLSAGLQPQPGEGLHVRQAGWGVGNESHTAGSVAPAKGEVKGRVDERGREGWTSP